MGYAPVADGFFAHPKVQKLGPDKSPLGLWVMALSWSTLYLTDGLLPGSLPLELCGRRGSKWARALVHVGLWDQKDDGYAIHDYLEWQKSRHEITELRRKRAMAGALGGQAKASSKPLASARQVLEQCSTHVSSLHDTSRHVTTPPVSPPTAVLPARSARVPTTAPPGFTAFWAAYPKRVGKDAAYKAWRSKGCEGKAAAVMAGLAKQGAFLSREGGKYTPNPATWLNQGRWQDEPPANGHQRGFGTQDMSGLEAFLEAHKHDPK